MPYNEFAIIERYFSKQAQKRPEVMLGIGDDGALTKAPPRHSLATTIDTMVSGVHFLVNVPPKTLGHKALAVSLSDLAAMGAAPAWAALAIGLPKVEPKWLHDFRRGFFALANKYGVQLIGGDTTRGPLSVTTHLTGFLPQNKALKRSGAKVGDLIYVTGTLGDAGLGLKILLKQQKIENAHDKNYLLKRLHCPEPRVSEGQALLNIAHAAIDISDGLVADLKHILEKSQVGATISVEKLPLSSVLQKNLSQEKAWELALSSGDDYELCFTIAPEQQKELQKISHNFSCGFTLIGKIEKQKGLRMKAYNNRIFRTQSSGYEHSWVGETD